MQQVVAKSGKISLAEAEVPEIDDNSILVRTAYSFISAGTERATLERGQKSLFAQVMEDPTRLKKAFRLFHQSGLKAVGEKAKGGALGYSSSGIVEQVGAAVEDFKVGDRVACAGRAYHAEVVSIPVNLATLIPDGCSMVNASTCAVGAIAMQGVRRSDLRLGDYGAVIGLGLIGQITAQLAHACGARTIGFDLDPRRAELANSIGVQTSTAKPSEQLQEVLAFTDDYGADATLITAATPSNQPLQSAIEMTRIKGTVVVVGDVGLSFNRSPFYEKELDLRISCSYGAGRYDASYESSGVDYPYGHVRWTAGRNMTEYLRLIAESRVRPEFFVEKTVPFQQAAEGYGLLLEQNNRPLGVVLDYGLES